MARYFFDVCDSRGSHRDDVGDELATFEDAREQCQILLPDVAREDLPDGELYAITCDVRDESGRVVYRGKLTYQGTRNPT